MKVFNLNTKSNFNQENLCITIGNFDGLHIGHQFVINKLIEEAKKSNLQSAVMSFTPHPREFFSQSKKVFNINTKNEKLNILKSIGIDIYIDFDFNDELANLSAKDFIKKIIIEKLNVEKIIIGSDFKFGKNRTGNLETLRELSKSFKFNLVVIDILSTKETKNKFSSSHIRNMIIEGNFIEVSHGNGYKTIYGHLSKRTVKRGEHVLRGQKIGEIGNTGRSTAPHLHYEVKRNNKRIWF